MAMGAGLKEHTGEHPRESNLIEGLRFLGRKPGAPADDCRLCKRVALSLPPLIPS
jgi:hypothetical protein